MTPCLGAAAQKDDPAIRGNVLAEEILSGKFQEGTRSRLKSAATGLFSRKRRKRSVKKHSFLKGLILLLLFFLIAVVLAAKVFLHQFATSEEFKRFAESRAGEYLRAKVSIGQIRPYHFNQLALENVIIELPEIRGNSQLIHLDRLLFRYHLSHLWKGKFDAPAGVTFRNPSLMIEEDKFPYQYFETAASAPGGFGMPTIDFKGGEIRYRVSSLGKDIVLRNIEGTITAEEGTKARVNIRATASGILVGGVDVHGTVDAFQKTHDLWLDLKGMDFSSEIPIRSGFDRKIALEWKNLSLSRCRRPSMDGTRKYRGLS